MIVILSENKDRVRLNYHPLIKLGKKGRFKVLMLEK